MADPAPFLSIILPCQNEEQALPSCLEEITAFLKTSRLKAEIIVIDNNSSDKSAEIVRARMKEIPELKLFEEQRSGYGSACLAGLRAAQGTYLFLADADATYSFAEIPRFVAKMKEGNDLVVGNRFGKGMQDGAMEWHKKFIGNPALSFLTRLLFKIKINDIHCGARMISREAFEKLTLYTGGMEFASEMIIKARKAGLQIAEIPIEYRKRIGTSKLEAAGDGWRHVRFMLLYSPLAFFCIPGILVFLIGVASMEILYFGHVKIAGLELYFHPLFLSSLLIILGYQIAFFGAFGKVYAITHLGDTDRNIERLFRHITIEKVGFAALAVAAIGAIIFLRIFFEWTSANFGALDETKNLIVALTLAALGIQTFFSAFMMSILGIKEK